MFEKTETQKVEITEIEINSGFSDEVFRPTFPAGARFWDYRDRKQYEVDAMGTLQSFQPKPAGIRGAVIAYHLTWISIAIAYLFTRRAGITDGVASSSL